MEADLFQEIFDVLESHKKRLNVNIQYGSPITKIVFSSFDYMSGPELKFCWIPRYAEPSLLVDDDDSSSDKITSSSKQNSDDFQYDESDFLTSTYECGVPERVDQIHVLPNWGENNEEVGTSTLRSSSYGNTTITFNNETKQDQENNDTDNQSSYTNVSNSNEGESIDGQNDSNGEHLKNSAMVTSCVDSGITGTISMHSNLSTCQSPKPSSSNVALQQHQPIDESCSDNQSDYGYCADETTEKADEDSENLIDCVGKHASASFLNASSNVLGLSMLGASLEYSRDVSEEAESLTLQPPGVDNQKVGDYQTLSDEDFIAKFVLAEQICSIQFESNPIVTKISSIPNRQLMACSFLFCAKDDVRSMMAISVILNEEAEEWYYSREKCFENIFVDIITRLKVSLLVESEADMICRITSDFIEFFNLWGMLERHQLLDSSNPWKIDLSKTWMDEYLNKIELKFLYKAITGCLLCQGCTVVIGNDLVLVEKIMLTLALFLHTSQRMLCIKPNLFHYNPYIKLQGLKRAETEDLYFLACESHWPVCFVDVDHKWVSTSGNYFTQHSRKEASQIYTLGQIFKEAGMELSAEDQYNSKRAPVITSIPIEVDPYVSNMLDVFFLLTPGEQNERIAFLQHFHMNLDYKARALLQTVKELSEPANNFKENFVSSKWSLSTARKLLNLNNESTFGIVLARADLITNSFAEFVYQTIKLHR